MAIKRFGDYDKTQAYGNYQQLPKDGYVVKIVNVVDHQQDGGYIEIDFDIAEGKYKGFYMNEWENQQKEDRKWHGQKRLYVPKDDGSENDGWTKRAFKTFTEALEESNPEYHFDWDEQKFKDKIVGGLFYLSEYQKRNGNGTAWATNLGTWCAVEKIRSGKFTLPKDKPLAGAPIPSNASAPSGDGWMNIPDGVDEELPFD